MVSEDSSHVDIEKLSFLVEFVVDYHMILRKDKNTSHNIDLVMN